MSSIQEEIIEGYFYFRARIKVLEKDASKNPLVVVFKGSESHGKNWSPDCKLLDGILTEFLEKNDIPPETYILKVKVGNSESWLKDDCPFRFDKKTHLNTIPTMILWSGTSEQEIKRLEGKAECVLENIHDIFLPNIPIIAPNAQLQTVSDEHIENTGSHEDFNHFETENEYE